MERGHLIFNVDLQVYIPTNITDWKEAQAKVKAMNELFPTEGKWDYSDAEWTDKYRK